MSDGITLAIMSDGITLENCEEPNRTRITTEEF